MRAMVKCLPLLLSVAALAGEPRFTVRPSAKRDGGKVVIEFAVAEPVDVAVFVKDHQGRTVRHLAAGVLGSKAPAPLLAGKLAQRLEWDRRDDDGRKVPSGKYSVEVALGLTPRYVGSMGWNPRALGHVHGLAMGPAGRIYVMSGVGRDSGDGRFQIFSAKGKYLRTILPRPADLPIDRVRPLGEMVLAGGERFPTTLLPQYGSRINQVPVVTADGDLIFANGPRRSNHPEGKRFQSVAHGANWPRRLLRLAADGGTPRAGYLGPVLGKGFERKPLYLALGPDGKTVYVSGARHAVFRVKWGEREKLQTFVGTPDKPGSGAGGLKDPRGIAFDAAGRLYVADRGNHRIVCFDASGKLAGEISVEWPSQVVVHPRTGEIYAACGYRRCRLLKFAGLGATAPEAEASLRSRWPILTLDPRGARPTLYVANTERRDPKTGKSWKALMRLLDTGKGFEEAGEISDDSGLLQPLLMGVDRRRELVYGQRGIFAEYARWDGRTGRVEPVPIPLHPKANGISEITAGADGTVAIHVQSEFGRLDSRLRPLPFDASGTFITRLRGDDCPRSFYDRGSCVAPRGGLYRIHERGGYAQPMRVSATNVDGTAGKDSLVIFETGSPAAVRVDRQGNVYVLDHLKPVGKPVPEALAGKVSVKRHNRFVYNYGSLLKFRPEGGAVRVLSKGPPRKRKLKPGQLRFTTAEGRGDIVTDGALWSYYGVSMIQPALGRGNYCNCWTPRFDIDDFARVFLPDQLRCRIVVLDSNGNVITTIGRYGNVDDRGPGVPLADPRTVMVSRRAVYIGDMTNGRIARAKLRYRASLSCSVEVAAELDPLAPAVLAVRREVAGLSPRAEREIDWRKLAADLGKRAGDPDEVRAAVCRASRDVALLGEYMRSKSGKLRLAVVWALYGGVGGEGGKLLLRKALVDRSELVRVAAADVLLGLGDTSGLAEIFRGARSHDPDVYKLAETAVLKKLLVWDEFRPQARLLEPRKCHVPRYAMGQAEVKVLGSLLVQLTTKDTRPSVKIAQHWFLREKTIYLLALSGQPEAVTPLLTALRLEKSNQWGRNRNRLIAALGLYRAREAVPDILEFLERGRGSALLRDRGDKAELQAATALERIADPESVSPIIKLLASAKPEVRTLSHRTLSRMFDPQTPDDRRLMPRGGKLVRVRVDELPEPAALHAAWGAFWKTNAENYDWSPKGPPLRRKAN